jgi:hypothetical protein
MVTNFEVYVGDDRLAFTVEGDVQQGSGGRMMQDENDLLAGTSWHDQGYTVAPFLPRDEDYRQLVASIGATIREFVAGAMGGNPGDFALEHYHTVVGSGPEYHQQIVDRTRDVEFSRLGIDPDLITARISELCGRTLSTHNPALDHDWFQIRIVRPFSGDNNPPHRDAYLDFYKRIVNLYVPIAASDLSSSLPLIPGSHLWPESWIRKTIGGSKVNGMTYRVPAITHAQDGLRMVRANPGFNEVLVFSPYLIHGSGVNLNATRTRVSLEVRLSAV